MIINLGSLIIGIPIGGTLILGFVWYFARHPEKVQKWSSMLFWLLSRLWNKADYIAITLEIQGKLNSFIRDLEGKTNIVFPIAKVQWVGKNNEGIQWEDGQIIIVMGNREHKNKNFVHAAHLFVSEILLRKSKTHLSKTQKTSLDLYATKKVLEAQSSSAVEQFIDDYLGPQIHKNDQIRGLVKQYLKIDTKGVFFPILINELIILGGKIFLEKPTEEVISEVRDLINFLEEFADREDNSDTGIREFTGKYTKCAIRIVAGKSTREKGDISVHKEGVLSLVRRGFENIYMVGMSDEKNIDFMESVANASIDDFESLICERKCKFPGLVKRNGQLKQVDTFFIHLHNPKAVKYLYVENSV